MTENLHEGLKWKEKAYELVYFSQRNLLVIAAELNFWEFEPIRGIRLVGEKKEVR